MAKEETENIQREVDSQRHCLAEKDRKVLDLNTLLQEEEEQTRKLREMLDSLNQNPPELQSSQEVAEGNEKAMQLISMVILCAELTEELRQATQEQSSLENQLKQNISDIERNKLFIRQATVSQLQVLYVYTLYICAWAIISVA